MTAPTEKAAPIPADVLAVAEQAAVDIHFEADDPVKIIASAILADREARPSLPDSREERIREDERDRLLERARKEHGVKAMWLVEEGAMPLADRARARQGGNNG